MASDSFRVLGLAGGIGSGKSAVAAILGELGFVVSDSDAGARAVLEQAEVVAELVEAFGRDVLDASGKPDRKAIADAVFGDDARRRTLERIVHPRLHAVRAQLIEVARADGAAGVVIDAPLLFEAGVDAECDAVIFVDTPRAIRLARVVDRRGWTEAELARRETAQMPLDQKRQRSDQVVINSGDLDALRVRVKTAVEAIKSGRDRP